MAEIKIAHGPRTGITRNIIRDRDSSAIRIVIRKQIIKQRASGTRCGLNLHAAAVPRLRVNNPPPQSSHLTARAADGFDINNIIIIITVIMPTTVIVCRFFRPRDRQVGFHKSSVFGGITNNTQHACPLRNQFSWRSKNPRKQNRAWHLDRAQRS